MRRIISTLTASAALLLAASANAAPCPPNAGGHYYGSTEIIPDVHASVVMWEEDGECAFTVNVDFNDDEGGLLGNAAYNESPGDEDPSSSAALREGCSIYKSSWWTGVGTDEPIWWLLEYRNGCGGSPPPNGMFGYFTFKVEDGEVVWISLTPIWNILTGGGKLFKAQ